MEMRPLDEIGRKMKEVRLTKGMTRKELAIISGVPVRTIKALEERGKNISGIRFIQMCLCLGVEDADDIIYIKAEQD